MVSQELSPLALWDLTGYHHHQGRLGRSHVPFLQNGCLRGFPHAQDRTLSVRSWSRTAMVATSPLVSSRSGENMVAEVP